MEKKLLFSLTKKDFEIQTFRAGGKGGQYQNKTESGVRIIHSASGAIGEARDGRSQSDNKANAFRRLVGSKKFKIWHKMEVARHLGQLQDIEVEIQKAIRPENLLVEVMNNGKWSKEQKAQ